MTVTRETLRDLALLCGNECTFPGCVAPIYDTVHSEYVGHVAHIKAQSPAGPRHDKSQTKEERDGLDNLMMLCGSHHRIIDDLGNVEAFSADVLSGYKKAHESRLSRNTILTESMIEEVVKKALLQAREVELELELEKKGLETRFPDDQFKYPPQVRNWIINNTPLLTWLVER